MTAKTLTTCSAIDRPWAPRVAVQPGRATLKMQLPAAHRFVPLMDHVNLPVRSLIDTNAGQAKVTTSTVLSSRRRRQSGVFSGGLFQVLQARKRRDRGITELRLKGSSFSGCRSPAPRTNTRGRTRAVASRLSRRSIRRLRGSAKGRFRTRGRHSAATVRGTKWTVADRCDGTLTTVTRGKVAVRDFRRQPQDHRPPARQKLPRTRPRVSRQLGSPHAAEVPIRASQGVDGSRFCRGRRGRNCVHRLVRQRHGYEGRLGGALLRAAS